MNRLPTLFLRACDESDPNSAACQKPTSQVLLNAVPAAIVGAMLVIAGIIFFIIARKRRRQFMANEAKERESLEIELYEPTNNRYHNPSHPDPFNDNHTLTRDPDYNEFSLAPPYQGREPSPANSSYTTESVNAPHTEMAAPPAYREENSGVITKDLTGNKA